MANTISSFPIDFDLYDVDEQQVLFITDDVVGQELTLEVTNTSDKPFALQPLDGDASVTNHHFELVFRPGTLYNNPAAVKLESTQFELFVNKDDQGMIQPNGDGSLSLFFKAREDWTLQEGDNLRIKLSRLRAEGTDGSRGTRVMLKYRNLLFAGNPDTLSGFKEMHLNIVNHRGKRNIPLHVGFVGSNTVLNDKGKTNSLKLRITNSSRKDVTIEALPKSSNTNKYSKLTLALEGGLPEDEWTVATVDQVAEVTLIYKRPGEEKSDPITNATVWEIPFMPLKKGQFIDVEITNLVTNHPTGHANLYLHYENIPGYWDGEIVTVLEKSPLVFRNKTAGLGNMPVDQVMMLVEGKEGRDSIVTRLSKQAIPEATNEAHLELYSPNTTKFDNYTKIQFHQSSQYSAWLGYRGTAAKSTGEFVFYNLNQSKPADLRVGQLQAANLKLENSMTLGIGKEIFFADNWQIRSLDNNHRIIFDRSNDVMELREYGRIIFSPGAQSGKRTEKVVFLSNGNVGIGTTNPGEKLTVSGTITCNAIQIGNTVIGEQELKILKKLAAGDLEVDIYNSYQQEYMYAATFAPFDNDRRRIFTWRPKGRVDQGRWKLHYPG